MQTFGDQQLSSDGLDQGHFHGIAVDDGCDHGAVCKHKHQHANGHNCLDIGVCHVRNEVETIDTAHL
jgi:hypothetical protein